MTFISKATFRAKKVTAATERPPIAGYSLWLKARGITGLADGASVSTWSPSGTSTISAIQSLSLRPLYKTGVINSLPVVRFDGVNDMMSLSSSLVLTSYTVFYVAKVVGASQYILGGDSGTYLPGLSSITNPTFNYNGSTSQVATHTSSSFQIITARRNAASHSYFVNGTSVGTSGNSNTATTILYLGARNSTDCISSADIAEIIVFPSAITGTDRLSVEAFLNGKYAIY